MWYCFISKTRIFSEIGGNVDRRIHPRGRGRREGGRSVFMRRKLYEQAESSNPPSWLTRDDDWRVRKRVAENISTPEAVLEALLSDKHPSVRKLARETLEKVTSKEA